ncbi:muc1-extracellular alpha-1,4-glucan glucosidase [Fusarium sporotrichioides]|uniref:Muc1-extracellular alpha-1,4-glucan glucosidase n=1 Tax=Fusarium sporotrichioides TaxID=5514 RepID=A0A395S604_FUSSP|nr:muc1-extracellular alpha-1,4-glucan glucosidase [Fusarium sporotrichioides]
MRPPKISLVTVLSVFLLLSCLLGSAAGSAGQQRPGRHRVVRSNRFIEARQPDGESNDGDGPPPPYYTGEPAVPIEMTSYSTSEGTTTTDINTGSSELHTSFGNYTLSLGISTRSLSTGLDTNTAAPSAASSAKAGGTTTSEALTAVGTTASGSSHVTRTSGGDASTTAGVQIPTALSNSTSPISTGSSAVTNRDSDSISMTGTASLGTELSSTSVLPVTTSNPSTRTETAVEDISLTDNNSSLEVSDTTNATAGTSATVESESLSESSQVTALTTATTRVFNTTVTVTDVVESTGLTPINGSSIVATSSESVSSVLSQTSTRGWTTVTISEENPTSVNEASSSVVTSSAQDGAIGISDSESTQKASAIASRSLNGTVSVTTTTYLTSTLDTATLSTEFSNQSSGSSIVTSDGLSGAGTGEPSQTIASMASSFSNVMSEVSTAITLASSDAESSASFTSTPALNETSEGSKSSIATAPIQTSSVPLVASSALPVNATSNVAVSSLTTTTVLETSVITVVPGGVSPTANATGMTSGSVSTDYSTSTASFFNSSMTRLGISSFQETSSLFDWSTSTVVESQHPQPTLGLPPISFTSFSFSIITTPMTPPSVATGSTSPTFENVTVISSTWTSTITTSLGPTGLTSPTKLSAAHSTSGYNFSKTIESEMSSVGSLPTSASNLTDISTSIITRQPTNLPFPTNTSIEWKSTMSSTLMTNSAKTINSQGPQTSSSTSGSIMNTTAPYANSTSITNSATYSPPFGNVTSSKLAITTYRSWNATNTAQGPVNSTVKTAISNTRTKSSMSAATNSLNWTATVTPPFPTTNHITLTTISGSVLTKTYTDVLVTIITPTDPVFWSSSIISSSLNNTPPFPFPSNMTVTGTGLPLPPTGTWTHPTTISSQGEFSTPYKESTSTSERKYHTSNATRHWSASGSSGSASGTNAPLFPSSNSTATATISFSSIVSWTPDPKPWTSWSTWDLTVKTGAPTSLGLPRVTTRNLSSETSESTSYTRTTTLVLTTTLAEPSTSQSKFQNSTEDSSSSISYTSTTTLFLTTTLGEPSTSRLSGAAITSTASTWMNTTLASMHPSETSTSLSEVSTTFLTTGSAKGIATSAGNSALTPFPVINSTLSQVSSLTIDTLTTTYTSDRPAGVTSPCESSSTTSSTCTDSLDYPPHGSLSAGSITTDCSTAHSMASYNTAHWSNMTETFGAKDTSTYGSLTTFKTVTTARADESNSVWDDYPTPTDRVTPSEVVPADPNFPWGNDSPIHRHQNMSDVGIGLDDGRVSKRGDWRLRWENVKDKINSLWHGQTLESEG